MNWEILTESKLVDKSRLDAGRFRLANRFNCAPFAFSSERFQKFFGKRAIFARGFRARLGVRFTGGDFCSARKRIDGKSIGG